MIITAKNIKERTPDYITNVINVSKIISGEYIDAKYKGKIGYNHYLLAIFNKELTVLEHKENLDKLKQYIKKETITYIWKEIINNLNLKELHYIQKEDIIDSILNNSKYNKYLLFNDIYSRVKSIIQLEGTNYTNELIEELKKINYTLPMLFFMELNVGLNLIPIIDNTRSANEFKFRFINNILIWMSTDTSYKASKVFSILYNQFLYSNDIFSKTVKGVLIKLIKHWINESIVSTIIGGLCNNIEEYDILINMLNKDQICLLKNIINHLYINKPYKELYVKDPQKYKDLKIVHINSPSVLLKVEENVTRLYHILKNEYCNIESITKSIFLEEFVKNEGICENISFTIQGINEIFLNEKLYCKELKEPALLEYRPSRIMCQNCYTEYKWSCDNVKQCKGNLSEEENKYRKETIEACLYKRLIYSHLCNYFTDEGHNQKIVELNKMLDKCQFLV